MNKGWCSTEVVFALFEVSRSAASFFKRDLGYNQIAANSDACLPSAVDSGRPQPSNEEMDLVNASNEALTNLGERMVEGNAAQEDDYKNKVDELFAKVDELEQRVNEVEQFYVKLKEPNTSRNASITKDKEKEKHIPSMKKLQQDASRREAAAAKRMQELMRQFGSIFRQACLLS
ncbi:UNVERIFIED_CONTAM: Transcription factor GTE6 [Sesamum latifolium]|uniref:Transcription factor GTE6 n=1 Tax=Sesamum latifolium TaxID=2727402 RepID=A0AAW2XEE3_9LAMI